MSSMSLTFCLGMAVVAVLDSWHGVISAAISAFCSKSTGRLMAGELSIAARNLLGAITTKSVDTF